MIEGYEWVGTALHLIGLFGLGVCIYWALSQAFPPPSDKEDHD